MAHDLFSLKERVALVTGGNGGIGRAMALGLAAAGAHVVVTGRDPAKNADAIGVTGTRSAADALLRSIERAVAALSAGPLGDDQLFVSPAGSVLPAGPSSPGSRRR